MFYYLLAPFLTYNFILIAAAVVPALFLMIKVYRSDRLEAEDPAFLRVLVTRGILSSLLALFEERILSLILASIVPEGTTLYNVLLYFVVVAVSEESSKYIFLRRTTWKSPHFNCRYDGVVYAVFVSLGFALWENISYVLTFGLSTALVRAVTAIPGHACFGVFMGVFYGTAKKYDNLGRGGASAVTRVLALLFPVLLHGAYDYIASSQETSLGYYFIPFVAVLFIASFIIVSRSSKTDEYIG
ncbi:MAG: PrsW family intramembrane metalloprotease [Clostridia bacterium]|nr:PrsW family intramembrane metalloprotease [Clostridia bacterium]